MADAGVEIALNGKTYKLAMSDCTALDAKDCRRQTGMSLNTIFGSASGESDLDSIAAMVWLARRHDGERELTYDDVASEITYGSDFKVAGAEEDTDSPE